MSSGVSRRQFLKFCAAAAATVPIMQAAAYALPRKRVAVRAMEEAIASPFSALPSALPLGAPLADISMGIDGTVWGIDTNGIPHKYDTLTQSWRVYGQSLSAYTYVSRWNGGTSSGPKYDKPLAVWGTLVSPPEGFISTIATTWPTLPDSFQLGLDGAAEADGVLYLFRHGRYVAIDPDTSVAGAPALLTSITNWPTTGNWAHGAITAVGSNMQDPTAKEVNFWCDGAVVTVDMTTTSVVAGPKPLSDVVSGQMLAAMAQGFDAEVFGATPYVVQAAQGPVKWVSTDPAGAATPNYMEADPQWNPRFLHAPTGRIGELWSVRTDGTPINHNGDGWQEITTIGYEFINISMGADGSVFGLSHFDNGQYPFNVWQLAADGHTFSGFMVFGDAADAVQVSAGDVDHVWMLDAAGKVYRAVPDGFQIVDSIGSATHIAANPDGTVWHARGDAFAHRFISEGQNPSTALAVAPAGSTVHRVASTSFGTGYFLTQPGAAAAGGGGDPQMYSYDSLYVWKTSDSYTPQLDYLGLSQSMIAVGNVLYLVSHLANVSNQGNARVAALDKQTGEELWHVDFNNLEWLGTWAQLTLTYDGALGLLYTIVGGNLHAIDAQTGDQIYTIPIKTNLELTSQLSPATLHNGQLCFADAYNQHIYMVDTAAAYALAKAGQSPTAAFIAVVLGSNESRWLGAPLFDPTTDIFYLVSMDPGARFPALSAYRTSGAMLWDAVFNQVPDSTYTLAHDVLFGATTASDATTVQALFVNTGGAVVAVDHATGAILHTFTPDANAVVSSALTYWNGRLYFGDANGTLYVINANTFALLGKTQDAKQAAWHGVLGHPAIVHSHSDDGDDSVAVYFARGDANIWLFDPESGNVESIMTDQSTILSVIYDDLHGVLYGCAGWWATLTADQSLGQVFAIRPDRAIQDARDFIIESQLMQDFASDDEANGDGIARYQTHVSVVDDNKAPRGNVAMRLWADEEDSDVTIDGVPFTIGPDTPAVFTTDAAGACTILSTADGDMASVTLRLWAAFMDVHERITIQTDVEFHQRLATNTSTGIDDPRKIDMQSASSYDGTPLFSDPNQAQQTSGAVSQTMGAVGMGQGGGSLLAAGSDPGKYFAYANLPGMGYSPSNVAVNRAVTPTTALGIHLHSAGVSTMSVANAANLIDGLQGDVAAAEIMSFASDIKAWWKSVKHALDSVEQVIVAVGSDIVVGIEYIVNGVKQVLKAVLKDIKDAALAIGAFFVQLGKDILKVLEALSVFLHMGKVVDTARIIRNFVTDSFTKMETILSEGKTLIDAKLLDAEDAITQDFCLLYENLGFPLPPECTTGAFTLGGGTTPLGSFGSMGSTPTTVYNQGNGSGQPSQAVQCGWSGHTLRNNAAQATTPLQSASTTDESVLIGLVTSFIDSLTSNAELAAAYQGVGASFQSTFKAGSVEQFLKSAVEDLLELVKAALITGLALVKAIVDTILSSIESIVAVLQDITSVNIPILSALWKKITGEDLTVLDLISFVVAFPVTFMYKAFDGSWPGDAVTAAETMPRAVRNVKGLMGSIASTMSGIFSALEDTDAKGVEPGFLRKMSALLTEITENGLGTLDTAYSGDAGSIMATTSSWIDLGVSLISPKLPKAYEGADEVVKFFTGLFNLFVYAGQGGNGAEIARGVVGTVPALVVWAKHIKGPAEIIPPLADIMCGLAVAGIELGITFSEWNGDDIEIPIPMRLSRQFLPLINHQPADYRQLLPSVVNGGGF